MADLTVMITRLVGKTHNFSISSRILFWSSLFLLCYLITSPIIIYKYFNLRHITIEKSIQIKHLKHDIIIMKADLRRATQQLSLYKNAIHDFQATRKKQNKTSKAESLDPKPAQIDAGSSPVEKKSNETKETFVGIDDFTVRKNGSGMDVRFKLVNLRQDKAVISGYVHIIAIDSKSDTPKLWPYPKTTLQNGIPANYKQGESFAINRFKIIEGKYSFESKAESPSVIMVLVYDKFGILSLQKEFEVEDIS